MDCILPGFSGHGILQASILEWVAISRGSSPARDQTHDPCISCISTLILLPLSHLGSPLNYTLVFNCPPGIYTTVFFKIICSRRPVFPQSIADQYSGKKKKKQKTLIRQLKCCHNVQRLKFFLTVNFNSCISFIRSR